MEAIRNYVGALFASLPQNEDTRRVQAEMLANLEEKFQALLDEGKTEAEAAGLVIASIGSLDELREELGVAAQSAPADAPAAAAAPELMREYRDYLDRKHKMIAGAVALFIAACGAYQVLDEVAGNKYLGQAAFLLLVAVGVALCIFSGRRDSYYHDLLGLGRTEDSKREAGRWAELFAGIAFTVGTAVYLCLGIFCNLWHPGWIIYPVLGLVTAAIACIEERLAPKD